MSDVSELTDLLDMAHDEFQRIHSLSWNDNPPSLGEIRSLCERGQQKITQRVPVIVQLAAATKRIEELLKDKERLDWLQKHRWDRTDCDITDVHFGQVVFTHYDNKESLRAGIDAVMKPAPLSPNCSVT